MVTFLLPRSQTLEIAQCPNIHLDVARDEKEPLTISFHRTSSKSPERSRHSTDSGEKPSKPKNTSRNSWFRSITSPFMNGGNSPRTEPSPTSPPLDAPTHVRHRTRSPVDIRKALTPRTGHVDPRLPDHMRRPELQLRRIQGRVHHPSKSHANRSNTVEQTQKNPLWWSA